GRGRLMRRGPKPAKSKVEPNSSVARKSPKRDGARVRDLEMRLADALDQLETSNRELAEARGQQTAASEILRVSSRAPADVQQVFDAIIASAVRLLRAYSGGFYRIAGGQLELAALTSIGDAADAALRAAFPQSLHSEGPIFWAIRDRAPLNVADAHTDER